MSIEARSSGPAEAELHIHTGEGDPKCLRLTDERVLIGRLQEARVSLPHPTVSRQHAELFRDPFGRWWIRDLGSRWGTLVNGRRTSEHLLTGQEEIAIGECRLTFRIPPPLRFSGVLADMPTAVADDSAACELSTLTDGRVPGIASEHLTTLVELGGKLMGTPDHEERLRILCECMTQRLAQDATALILRVAPERPDEPPRVLMRESSSLAQDGTTPHVSRTLLRRVCETRAPTLASNVPVGLIDVQLSVSPAQVRMAAMACPLDAAGAWMDVFYVVLPPRYGTSQWLSLASLAAAHLEQAESAWRLHDRLKSHELVERELRRARDIQSRLLPRKLAYPNMDLAIGFQPCRWVGGDYVDVMSLSENRILLIIADVSGKGLPAALITGNLHAIVHANISDDFQLASMVQNINHYLGAYLLADSFVTIACMTLDTETGEYECITAGHPRPLLVTEGGRVQEIETSVHMPLGIDTLLFQCDHGRLSHGHWMILYTDGAADVCNEQDVRLNTEGLLDIVQTLFGRAKGASAQDVVTHLNQALDEYQGRSLPADDRTFLVLRRLEGVST